MSFCIKHTEVRKGWVLVRKLIWKGCLCVWGTLVCIQHVNSREGKVGFVEHKGGLLK